MNTKSKLKSWTIQGAVASIILRLFGISGEVSGQDVFSVLDLLKDAWPLFVGILADLATKWERIKETGFLDKAFYKKNAFWAALVALLATIVPPDLKIEDTIKHIESTIPTILLLVANVWQIIGAARSKTQIQ